MDSFTFEPVSNASFDCYPNNSLSSFTNFPPEQIHLKGELEVAISEISYPSLYQNVTEGKICKGNLGNLILCKSAFFICKCKFLQ